MAGRSPEMGLDFDLKAVVDKFGDSIDHPTLYRLGYDLSHILFDGLAHLENGCDLTINALREAAYDAARKLGENYIVIDKRDFR